MVKTANETILDNSVAHQIGLERFTLSTVRKILALSSRTENDIVNQITKIDTTDVRGRNAARLDRVLVNTQAIAKEASEAINKALDDDVKELSEYEGEFQLKLITTASPVKLALETPSASKLYAAVHSRPFQGRLLREWYDGYSDANQKRLREAIRIGFTEGETIDQLIRRVRGTRNNNYRDGILEVSRRGADALVRTALNHTANAASEEFYAANLEVIKGVRWVSTLDARTTTICASRDGKVYPPDSGPRPPAHIRCRSFTAPVLKSWKELGINLSEAPAGTRASMDGQIPEAQTYDTWLRTKEKAFQEDVLGVTKSKLFRAGLTLDKFVDRLGAEYTIKELAQRETKLFETVGLNL